MTAGNASYESHHAQIAAIFSAWAMPADKAAQTADVMAWADLHGIDSHGISLLPPYDVRRRSGRLRMEATPQIVNDTPVSALIDADGGLGYVPGRLAMQTAIDKARGIGIGVATVHNSSHFGACGYYAAMAAEAGFVGMVASSASGIQVAPTGSGVPRFGTDPWAFAAPGKPGEPFLLDMATTTVAAGRIRNRANEGLPCPPGWVLAADGSPSIDPLEASEKGGSMTSLGGSEEGGSYKGYGLAAMVNILASCLSGATLITDAPDPKSRIAMDIGHFFLALNPALFREPGAFETDVARFCNSLRTTPPINPARPVQVAGDPQRAIAAQRRRDGIPVGPNLLQKVRTIAQECGAPWLL